MASTRNPPADSSCASGSQRVNSDGSSFSATNSRLAGENIVAVLNLDMLAWDSNGDGLCDVHASNTGSPPALADLMAGQVAMYFAVPAGSLPYIRSNKLRALGTSGRPLCLFGHTHAPFAARLRADELEFVDASAGQVIRVGDGASLLVNVGSVGQPRDGDPRACYVLYDGATVRYRRVEYEIAKTIEKIRRIPQIDPRFGERLLKGR